MHKEQGELGWEEYWQIIRMDFEYENREGCSSSIRYSTYGKTFYDCVVEAIMTLNKYKKPLTSVVLTHFDIDGKSRKNWKWAVNNDQRVLILTSPDNEMYWSLDCGNEANHTCDECQTIYDSEGGCE